MLMADKYGSILNPYYIMYMGPTSSNNVNDVIPTYVFILCFYTFLLGRSRVHWIVLQF